MSDTDERLIGVAHTIGWIKPFEQRRPPRPCRIMKPLFAGSIPARASKQDPCLLPRFGGPPARANLDSGAQAHRMSCNVR